MKMKCNCSGDKARPFETKTVVLVKKVLFFILKENWSKSYTYCYCGYIQLECYVLRQMPFKLQTKLSGIQTNRRRPDYLCLFLHWTHFSKTGTSRVFENCTTVGIWLPDTKGREPNAYCTPRILRCWNRCQNRFSRQQQGSFKIFSDRVVWYNH